MALKIISSKFTLTKCEYEYQIAKPIVSTFSQNEEEAYPLYLEFVKYFPYMLIYYLIWFIEKVV